LNRHTRADVNLYETFTLLKLGESMGRKGATVIEIHRRAVEVCKAADKAGWDLLSCIVDAMQVAYGKITEAEFKTRQPGVSVPR